MREGAAPRTLRPATNEIQRRTLLRHAREIEKATATRFRWISRSGSAAFAGLGLFLMRREIATAFHGVTTGSIDRQRRAPASQDR